MDQNRVINILNLTSFPPREVLQEIVEEEVFTIREYFLRQPIITVLYKSRMRKLQQIGEIEMEFELCNANFPEPKLDLTLDPNSFLTLLKSYEEAISTLRFHISQTLNSRAIATLSGQLITIQKEYEVRFLNLAETRFKKDSRTLLEVKAADQIDSGVVIQWLKHEDEASEEALFKEYSRIKSLIS